MDSLQIILTGFLNGLKDSVLVIKRVIDLDRKQNNAIQMKKETDRGPSLRKRIFQCCALNAGVFGVSIYVFSCIFLPAINFFVRAILANSPFEASKIWSIMDLILTYTFKCLWVIPVWLICKLVNMIWFQDIAKTAFKYSSNRPQTKFDIGNVIADLLFSLIIQSLFLLQGNLAVYLIPIPFLGFVISWINFSLLYSFYAFEYKWFYLGWELHSRLSYIEENWYYFVGFGFPLQLITWLPGDLFLSGCAYAVAFPWFLIGSFKAQPSQVQGNRNIRLRFFSPVVCISNFCFQSFLKGRPTSVKRS